MTGVFCEIYGKSVHNKVLEYLFTFSESDFAISDVAQDAGISRPKAYEFISLFEKKGYLLKSRIIGRTQLYKLKKDNDAVKLLTKSFNECLKVVASQASEKTSGSQGQLSHGVRVASVKGI